MSDQSETSCVAEGDNSPGHSKHEFTDSRSGKDNTVLSVVLELIVFLTRMIIIYVFSVVRLIYPHKKTSVAGKKVLITGAGHGIGKELAKQYGQLGAEVICVDINSQTNQETVNMLKKQGIEAHAITCDISSRDKVLELGKKVEQEIGDIDILINNAGVMPCKKFEQHSDKEILKMFDINVFAHFWMLEAFLPQMKSRNSGHIVALSSMAGNVGIPNLVPYSSAKFAVRGYMEALSEELRRDGKKVRFTTVYPFMTDTGLCKHPRMRFPSIMKLVPVEETAAAVVAAQRRGWREAGVPQYLLYINNIMRLMPRACGNLLLDFLDSGVDPDD